MRILVTGFEPFGGDAENASREAVLALEASWHEASIEIVTAILPVSFARAPARLGELVAQLAPAAVVAVGEAGGRSAITPERYGHNRMDARIADEDGAQPRDEPIDDGPDLRISAFDVDELVDRLRDAGIHAEASDDAGGFVCNRIAVAVAALAVPGGFVHVPAVRSTGIATVGAETDAVAGARSTLTIDDIASGLAVVVRHAAHVAGG